MVFLGIGCSLLGLVVLAQTPDKPVQRTFRAGSIANFGVELRVRSEVGGQKATTIGSKTYVQPVSEWVEQRLAWQASRRVESVAGDGSAQTQEELDNFSDAESSSDDSADTHKLLDALAISMKPWEASRTLRYREAPAGQISGLGPDAAPPLDEAGPRVLTAWLLRALRPTAVLPAHPLLFNQSWQEPRTVPFAEWSNTSGSESGEWLGDDAGRKPRGEPTVQLLATDEISGSVTAGSEKPAEGSATAHFHAESLSTLALDDLRLTSASRSAVREITWTLAPVEGLSTPPQFQGRLSVEIRIQACDETPCTYIGHAVGGSGR